MPYYLNNKVVYSNLYDYRNLIGDLSRCYLFQIEIPFISESSDEIEIISMLAKSTVLPAYEIDEKSIDFRDYKIKIAGSANFSSWNVTFYVDEYHKIRHRFLAWQALIYDPVRQISFSPNSYKKKISAFLLSKNGLPVTGYEFFGAFPKRVGEINIGHSIKEFAEFVVEFSYDYFVIDTKLATDKKLSENEPKEDPSFSKIVSVISDKFTDNQIITNGINSKINESAIKNESETDQNEKNINEITNSSVKEFKDEDSINSVNKEKVIKSQNSSSINSVRKSFINNFSEETTLLTDPAGNKEINVNGIQAQEQKSEMFLVRFVKNWINSFNPFATGDINTPDPVTFYDAVNIMTWKISPPIRWRIRNLLGDKANKIIDRVMNAPIYNPFSAVNYVAQKTVIKEMNNQVNKRINIK